MTYPALSYTLANGTTADANKVQQNFQDLLDGATNGSKDAHVNTLAVESNMTQKQIAAPAANPSAGYIKTWFDTMNVQHFLNSSGITGMIGGGSGGSAVNWELIYAPAPVASDEQGIRTLEFNETDSQGIYAHLTVPADYIAGRRIYLKGGKFAISATSNNMLFRSTAYIIRPEVTELATFTSYHDSTNTQLTAVTANVIRYIGDLDITDTDGLIDSYTVQANDTILVFLQRKIASESVAATFSARLLRDSFYPVFS
jgi:hypothetical protein